MARRVGAATARGLLLLTASSGTLSVLGSRSNAAGAAHVTVARGASGRETEGETGETESRYNVHLLVTRHGLSCTNVAQKWVGSLDFGRANIHDPLLSGAAWKHAEQARAAATKWLAESNLTMDGAVSSVLARAIQTTLLTYPQGTSTPVHVVPYIRETGRGLSNAPKEQSDQVSDLNRSLGALGAFRLDYHWTDVYGRDELSWPKFETFLEQSFLPTLIRDTGKPPGSPIVLGVVTHSNFIKESKLAAGCGKFWKSKGEKKMLNNQILVVRYELRAITPAPGSIDRTKRYSLNMEQYPSPCEEVFAGASVKESTGTGERKLRTLCFPDVGDDCNSLINQHSLAPHVLFRNTREAQILKMAERENSLKREIAWREREIERGPIPGPTRTEELRMGTSVDQLREEVAQKKVQLKKTGQNLRALRDAECWSGRKPEVAKFCEFHGGEFKVSDSSFNACTQKVIDAIEKSAAPRQ